MEAISPWFSTNHYCPKASWRNGIFLDVTSHAKHTSVAQYHPSSCRTSYYPPGWHEVSQRCAPALPSNVSKCAIFSGLRGPRCRYPPFLQPPSTCRILPSCYCYARQYRWIPSHPSCRHSSHASNNHATQLSRLCDGCNKDLASGERSLHGLAHYEWSHQRLSCGGDENVVGTTPKIGFGWDDWEGEERMDDTKCGVFTGRRPRRNHRLREGMMVIPGGRLFCSMLGHFCRNANDIPLLIHTGLNHMWFVLAYIDQNASRYQHFHKNHIYKNLIKPVFLYPNSVYLTPLRII